MLARLGPSCIKHEARSLLAWHLKCNVHLARTRAYPESPARTRALEVTWRTRLPVTKSLRTLRSLSFNGRSNSSWPHATSTSLSTEGRCKRTGPQAGGPLAKSCFLHWSLELELDACNISLTPNWWRCTRKGHLHDNFQVLKPSAPRGQCQLALAR